MRNKVLIVDDVKLNREMLSEILENEYVPVEAADGDDAVCKIDRFEKEIAVILLDLIMPKADGFTVLEAMRQKELLNKIPVVIISSERSIETEKRCYEYGIIDFIGRPFDNELVKKRIENVIKLSQYQSLLEEKVSEQTRAIDRQYNILLRQAKKLKESNERIIDVLGEVVEYRNLESGEHIKRVKGYTDIIAREMMEKYPEYGLNEDKISMIVSASALHDIGKIAIPDSILLKPARLTDKERETMQTHTTRGCELLGSIKGVWDEKYAKVSYEICRYHHERYDGNGYPDGLAGEEIPIAAQLVSLPDVYDALVSERVYKKAFSVEQAYEMINGGSCGVFSPKLLECFCSVREKFESLAV